MNDGKSSSEQTNQTLRRSERQRIKPLEYWRGQRPLYKRNSAQPNEMGSLLTIEEGTPPDPLKFANRFSKKRKAVFDQRSNSRINIFNLSIHCKRVKFNNKNKNSVNVKSFDDLIWKESSQSKGVDIAIINKDKVKGEALGMLRIKGMGEKTKSKTGGYKSYLILTIGVLGLKIEDNKEVLIKTGDSFTVNSYTNYSLVNLRKDMAYLSFTVLKD